MNLKYYRVETHERVCLDAIFAVEPEKAQKTIRAFAEYHEEAEGKSEQELLEHCLKRYSRQIYGLCLEGLDKAPSIMVNRIAQMDGFFHANGSLGIKLVKVNFGVSGKVPFRVTQVEEPPLYAQ